MSDSSSPNPTVREVQNEYDVNILIELGKRTVDLIESDGERLKSDFKKGYFRAFLVLPNSSKTDYSIDSVLGYFTCYNSYSSWQNRVLYIGDFWLSKSVRSNDQLHLSIMTETRNTLFLICRQNDYQRINMNVKHLSENESLINLLLSDHLGAFNLSKDEDWFLFEMRTNEMNSFLNNKPTVSPSFKVIKVDNINKYCHQIRDLIKEIAIFEKLEEQFKTSAESMIRDYKHVNHESYDGSISHLNRFYEAMVVIKEDEVTQEQSVIGYSIYYFNYDMKRGRGSYLEDLYIQEKYRQNGLGTFLWRQVIEDCLINHHASFMQWSVLEWNKPAIELYLKYKSVNLTNSDDRLNLYRFVTEKIYSQPA
jgi:ribosomal protein S18 acetylase RimI-like enzyme